MLDLSSSIGKVPFAQPPTTNDKPPGPYDDEDQPPKSYDDKGVSLCDELLRAEKCASTSTLDSCVECDNKCISLDEDRAVAEVNESEASKRGKATRAVEGENEEEAATMEALREKLRQAEDDGTVLASQLMRAREELLNEVSTSVLNNSKRSS